MCRAGGEIQDLSPFYKITNCTNINQIWTRMAYDRMLATVVFSVTSIGESGTGTKFDSPCG